MRVEPFGFPLENNLTRKIDIMLERCTQKNPKRDAVLLIEGPEGEGKTTLSIALGYYAKQKTGRNFNHKNLFFDLGKMIDFLKTTEDQIVIWDEPALHAMAKDALTNMVKDMERLLTMARKKRHFIMINISYFHMFNQYIVWQRPLGMIHVYSRREVEPGRFVYIKKRNLELLWHDWRSKRKRNYKKYCSKSIRGTFPDVLNPEYKKNVLADFDVDSYEKEKDKAIASIGESQVKSVEYPKIKNMAANLLLYFHKKEMLNTKEIENIMKHYGYTLRTYYLWRKLVPPDENPLEKPILKG